MAEADHDLFVFDAGANVGLGFVRIFIALLDFECDFVGAAVLGAAQCADAT